MNTALWNQRFEDYLRRCERSVHTVRTYLFSLRDFYLFLTEAGLEQPWHATREHLQAYRQRLFERSYRGQRNSLKAQQCRLGAVRSFLRFLKRDGYHPVDLSEHLEPARVIPAPLPQLPSEVDLQRVLDGIDVSSALGLRNRAMLETLYSTGLRSLELRALRLDQLDLVRQVIWVHRGKGGRSRSVPLGGEARAWIEQYLLRVRPQLVRDPAEPHLFLSQRGRPMTCTQLTTLVRDAARAASLDLTLTPHTFRHCCATHMLRRGAGLRHVQSILGHVSPASTQRYTQLELSDLQRIHQRCHPRERGDLR